MRERTFDSGPIWYAGLLVVLVAYLHNTLPHLTMIPRVNVDEPWLMERGFQVLSTGIPSQPMLGLQHAYLLQVGYGYLLAGWMALFGVSLFQARLLGVLLGLGIVVMVAGIGRRAIDPVTGLSAALFLALDSNFLGGVRNARTDIPALFFVVGALAAYLRGQQREAWGWFVCSGASLGLAMLCHGNAFWAGAILLVWYFLDYGRRGWTIRYGYAWALGFLLTFGPYLAMVVARWSDVQVQIGNFAADRVPGWRPSFVLHQMLAEGQRYRGWYFGLVTSKVPNPLLWTFQAIIPVGLVALAVRSLDGSASNGRAASDPHGPFRLLVLALGSVVIFAGFINNKVPVYMPHLLVGFALAAGFAVRSAVSLVPARRRAIGAGVFLVGLAASGIAYYEKWYATVSKSELVPYEATEATLNALVPGGPKYVFASPQFWTPFHDQPGTRFYSYAAAQPLPSGSGFSLAGVQDDRPIFLIVDEYEWLPELIGVTSSTPAWQQNWIAFIEQRCSQPAVALGTAHGTLGLYQCNLSGAPPSQTGAPRIVGGSADYQPAEVVLRCASSDLARWNRYHDPRSHGGSSAGVKQIGDSLQISGAGWPGIVKMVAATPGEAYLVRTRTRNTRDGDLLYMGTWRQPQVLSLSGASSAGIAAPLLAPSWFPRERAFRATAPDVRFLVYSEAPDTDFTISSLEVSRLVARH